MIDATASLRALAASILRSAGTLAAARVDEERIDPVADGDVPRLIVFADQSAQGISPAGTALTFDVTAQVTVQALVQQAKHADAVAQLDVLVYQVKAALLTNPAFTTQFQSCSSLRVTSSFKGGDTVTGDARIQLAVHWRETYDPDPGPQLSAVGGTVGTAPDAKQFVFAT